MSSHAFLLLAAWATLSAGLLRAEEKTALEPLLPQLASEDFAVRTAAQKALAQAVAQTGRPGAKDERLALCLEIGRAIQAGAPLPAATELIRQLTWIGAEESVALLEGLLTHDEALLREEARRALEKNPSARAGQALLRALPQCKDSRLVIGLIHSLAVRDEKGATQAILPYLKSTEPPLREAAIDALVHVADAAAVAALVQARNATEGLQKNRLTAALFDAGKSNADKGRRKLAEAIFVELLKKGEPEATQATALLHLARTRPDKAEQLVTWALDQPSEIIRRAAVEAVSQLRTDKLYQALAAQLEKAPAPQQIHMLGVLADPKNTRFAGQAETLLSADQPDLAAAAARALAVIGQASSLPGLLKAAARADEVGKAAALALTQVPGVDEPLMAAARTGDASTRVLAITALGARDRARMEELLAWSNEADEKVAAAALRILQNRAGSEQLPALLASMKKPASEAMGKKILSLVVSIMTAAQGKEQEEVVALLAREMASPASVEYHALILQALGRAGTKQALAPLLKAAVSDKPGLREAALRVLVQWKGDEAVEPLLKMAAQASTPEPLQALALGAAIQKIAAMKEEAAVPLLVRARQAAKRPEEKKALFEALKKFKGPAAKELQDALRAENPALE